MVTIKEDVKEGVKEDEVLKKMLRGSPGEVLRDVSTAVRGKDVVLLVPYPSAVEVGSIVTKNVAKVVFVYEFITPKERVEIDELVKQLGEELQLDVVSVSLRYYKIPITDALTYLVFDSGKVVEELYKEYMAQKAAAVPPRYETSPRPFLHILTNEEGDVVRYRNLKVITVPRHTLDGASLKDYSRVGMDVPVAPVKPTQTPRKRAEPAQTLEPDIKPVWYIVPIVGNVDIPEVLAIMKRIAACGKDFPISLMGAILVGRGIKAITVRTQLAAALNDIDDPALMLCRVETMAPDGPFPEASPETLYYMKHEDNEVWGAIRDRLQDADVVPNVDLDDMTLYPMVLRNVDVASPVAKKRDAVAPAAVAPTAAAPTAVAPTAVAPPAYPQFVPSKKSSKKSLAQQAKDAEAKAAMTATATATAKASSTPAHLRPSRMPTRAPTPPLYSPPSSPPPLSSPQALSSHAPSPPPFTLQPKGLSKNAKPFVPSKPVAPTKPPVPTRPKVAPAKPAVAPAKPAVAPAKPVRPHYSSDEEEIDSTDVNQWKRSVELLKKRCDEKLADAERELQGLRDHDELLIEQLKRNCQLEMEKLVAENVATKKKLLQVQNAHSADSKQVRRDMQKVKEQCEHDRLESVRKQEGERDALLRKLDLLKTELEAERDAKRKTEHKLLSLSSPAPYAAPSKVFPSTNPPLTEAIEEFRRTYGFRRGAMRYNRPMPIKQIISDMSSVESVWRLTDPQRAAMIAELQDLFLKFGTSGSDGLTRVEFTM